MTKYIFVTGGVVSGLGKGITAASLGRLLKQRGLLVAAQKLDPYMNIDPGTMSPFQHGEVFVTDDGAETDLDLGHYERFIDENLTKLSNLTSGKVYLDVLERERAGKYLGGTVQVIPHVTEAIKRFIYAGATSSGADVLITEIGGTTGDIESQPFLEAIRQISREQGHENCLFIHVTLVPYLKGSDEHKSKPTQHSVKELRAMGISPSIIIARADEPLDEGIRKKIALFCNVKADCVIENTTVPSLYEAPLMLHRNGLDRVVCRELLLTTKEPDLADWQRMVQKIAMREKEVRIAIVGKYVRLHDAYLSITESLHHAGFELGAKVQIHWVDSEGLTEANIAERLHGCDGIIIPGGFGERGVEGKIAACRYAREQNIPFLGICLGLQIAVIEFARHVCGLDGASSGEFDRAAPHRVIDIMPGQEGREGSGGTMRLGAYACRVAPGSLMRRLYGADEISERHRHRFEVNNAYRDALTQGGLAICGTSPDGSLVEAMELPGHRFFVGVQFHPEFKSRPDKPHPLFLGLVQAAAGGHGAGEMAPERDYAQETARRVAFIRQTLAAAGSAGIVYGNSGGKDSALVGILCKMACENTVGVILPCASSRNYGADREDALRVAEQFSIEVREVDLTETRATLLRALGDPARLTDAALANIAPRLRMTALYAIAGSEGRLVAGTGNRSEAYMGYFTKWGDGAHDFNPIADLTVTEIYAFLRHLNAPEAVIAKAPSAGLFEGQTDEAEMGVRYESIDALLLTGTTQARDKAIIDRLHAASEHKRRPPVVPPQA